MKTKEFRVLNIKKDLLERLLYRWKVMVLNSGNWGFFLQNCQGSRRRG
jgi:hypothetical protein